MRSECSPLVRGDRQHGGILDGEDGPDRPVGDLSEGEPGPRGVCLDDQDGDQRERSDEYDRLYRRMNAWSSCRQAGDAKKGCDACVSSERLRL